MTHVLSFLQNLCEGHFLAMQNLLRVQTASSRGFSVDLVSAVAHYVIELETSVSPLNVPPPPSRTNRTSLVPPPVLSGHAASLTPY